MSYDASNLICIAGNSRASQWAYRTADRLGDVLAPVYFPDDRMRNFMHPGELLTLTCLPPVAPKSSHGLSPSRRRRNPVAVLQAVTARTREGIWLVLPLKPITRPETIAAGHVETPST